MNSSFSGKPVALNQVRKSYNGTGILKNISLDISAGRFCTFLGASGSGKSTLLKIIAGFEYADSGEISIGGRNMAQVPARRRNIGMVFQNYALFPNMSVARNIAFGLETRRVSRNETRARVNEMLEIIGLSGFGDRLPSELSGGQQQRVALARAMVIRPDVLLMDEPLGALDRVIRQSLQTQIKDIQRSFGITILFVTHDQEEALHMSDDVVIMRDGMIEQIGSPQDLYARPINRFVGSFLGDCNFISRNGKEYAIRPEATHVGDASNGRDHILDGVLSQIVFLGGREKLTVMVGDMNFTAIRNVSNTNEPIVPGSPVRIGFSLRDATALAK